MRKVEQSCFFFLKEKGNVIFFTKGKESGSSCSSTFSGRQDSKEKICCKENFFDAFWAKYARLLKDRERKQGGE